MTHLECECGISYRRNGEEEGEEGEEEEEEEDEEEEEEEEKEEGSRGEWRTRVIVMNEEPA